MAILAGDIGGTHTRLALFAPQGDFTVILEKKYSSREHKGLQEIVELFLQETKKKVIAACFGIAGPVRDERCHATNLPWIVDATQLSSHLKISSVHLLNDLEANAYGLYALKKEEFCCLQPGTAQKGNQALIAAGTGLGEAGLFWDGKMHHPFACEGGHADFSPRNELEIELFLFLQKQFGHVSWERVISGPGLYGIYLFLTQTKREIASLEVEAKIKQQDPPAVVSEYGRLGKDRACQRAVDWFISLYGAESGNLALKFLALGGFYIGGGIAPHLLEGLKKGTFISSFVEKGRFKSLLQQVPVHVVLNDNAALLGAARFGRLHAKS